MKHITAGEMLSWTNRLKEVRNIKDGYIRGQRMHSLWLDFVDTHRGSRDPFVLRLHKTLDYEHFMHV